MPVWARARFKLELDRWLGCESDLMVNEQLVVGTIVLTYCNMMPLTDRARGACICALCLCGRGATAYADESPRPLGLPDRLRG